MTVLAPALLAVVLGFAVLAPRGLPEAVVAVPAAVLVLALGVVSPARALAEVRALGPTVAFLATVLVLAHLADVVGVFRWVASVLARSARGDPRRLLVGVFVVGATCTAVLNLDATVVLLTPAVLATAVVLRLAVRPHAYATVHLANSASLLLPVSNLTNLLAFTASGLTFAGFTALMALPWLVAVLLELAVLSVFFRRELRPVDRPVLERSPVPPPTLALAVLAAVLLGFGVSGVVGLKPVWVSAAGVLVLAGPALRTGRTRATALVREASPLFCVFVLALGVVVAGVSDGPLGGELARRLPTEPSLLGLLAVAGVAAVLANVLNNLPATLVLLAALGAQAPTGLVLAALIGVNVGPNLTYVGSLATLLWRRVLRAHEHEPQVRTFTLLGLVTVPLVILGSVVALWVGLQVGPT